MDGDDFYIDLSQKQQLNEVAGARFYKYMGECIDSERKRIGGNWVVAQAVPTRNMRDVIRKVLGKDLVFILLRYCSKLSKNICVFSRLFLQQFITESYSDYDNGTLPHFTMRLPLCYDS